MTLKMCIDGPRVGTMATTDGVPISRGYLFQLTLKERLAWMDFYRLKIAPYYWVYDIKDHWLEYRGESPWQC